MTTTAPLAAVPEFTLGDRLAKARQYAGKSSQDMADATLRARQTITNYEQGHTTPTAKVLVRWAEVCGVDLDWLRYGQVTTSPDPESGRGVGFPVTVRIHEMAA